jgi:cytochrome c biogenesis protein CcmG/thiol:disulfide interchange protein DsbE
MLTVRVLGMATIAVIVVTALLAVPSHGARQLPSEPTFSVAALQPEGPAVTQATGTGRVTVLLFWASWCVPCRSELPAVTSHLATTSPQTTVVGMDTNDGRADGLDFLRSIGATLPSGFDDQGRVAVAFRLYGLPAAAVVTPSGRIAARFLGPVTGPQLSAAVTRAARA